MSLDNVKLSIKNLDLFYGDNQALKNINIDIKENKVTALIGPSGCGKSTFLRTLNRMNDLIENVTIKGKIEVDGSFGPATVRRTQQFLGTTVDGIVSNQPSSNKKYLYSAYDGCWEFKSSGYSQGSDMVRKLQKLIGTTQDGWFGQASVKAFQKFLGVTQDGSMGPATVKAWQTYLNNR